MKKIFTEFNIKNVKIKNRVCVPPMAAGFANDGYATLENVNHYKELAKGARG